MKIFISYRRNDSQYIADRIRQAAAREFGDENIFKDIEGIKPGEKFPEVIKRQVGRCDCVLAVIGDRWLTTTTEDGGRRLDDPSDWVRIELEEAMERGLPIIPLLVNGAKMPAPPELPPSLTKLPTYHGIAVRPDPDFAHDMERLIEGLKGADPVPRRPRHLSGAFGTLALLALGVILYQGSQNPSEKSAMQGSTTPLAAPDQQQLPVASVVDNPPLQPTPHPVMPPENPGSQPIGPTNGSSAQPTTTGTHDDEDEDASIPGRVRLEHTFTRLCSLSSKDESGRMWLRVLGPCELAEIEPITKAAKSGGVMVDVVTYPTPYFGAPTGYTMMGDLLGRALIAADATQRPKMWMEGWRAYRGSATERPSSTARMVLMIGDLGDKSSLTSKQNLMASWIEWLLEQKLDVYVAASTNPWTSNTEGRDKVVQAAKEAGRVLVIDDSPTAAGFAGFLAQVKEQRARGRAR